MSKLREQLAYHLSGHGAHISFEAAVEGLPFDLTGKQVPNLAHTARQLERLIEEGYARIVALVEGAGEG